MNLTALILTSLNSSRVCHRCASKTTKRLLSSLATVKDKPVEKKGDASSSVTEDVQGLPRILPDTIEEPVVVKSYPPKSSLKHCDNLLQFFEPKEFWGRKLVESSKTGQAWTIEALRLKSNTDLHKLWYILLKERNMLLTLDLECEMTDRTTPGEERIEKVEQSMENILQLVEERNEAYHLLEKGRGRPKGAYAWSVFGFRYWKEFKEHAMPWWENEKVKLDNLEYRDYVIPWMRLRLERRRAKEFARSKYFLKRAQESQRKYPNVPMPTLEPVKPLSEKKFNLKEYMRKHKSDSTQKVPSIND